jgi:hypothetical protein
VAQVPWASARLLRGEPVSFSNLGGLPAEAAADVGFYRDAGLQAALMLPLTLGGRILGALSFAALHRERDWPDALVRRLRLVAEIFGNALARRRGAGPGLPRPSV